MLNVSATLGGKRDDWEFEYTARKLAVGATAQREFRLSRVQWWSAKKEEIMTKIRESGVQINESVAASMSYMSNTTQAIQPTVSIDQNLQRQLAECHQKIQSHQQAAAEYDGWIQVLEANAEARQRLTHADWLYFFGKV